MNFMLTNIHHVSAVLVILCCPLIADAASVHPAADADAASNASVQVKGFLQAHCFDCHNADNAEAGFDLDQLGDHATAENFDRWVEVFDRVADAEMPPADMDRPKKKELSAFLSSTKKTLHQRQQSEFNQF